MTEIKLVKSEDTRRLRRAVFAEEQKYPADALIDEHEEEAEFLAFCEDGKIIGCGRFYKEDGETFHIDNIAFDKSARGRGFGREFIKNLITQAENRGAVCVTVNAKIEAVGFYEKCGFKKCGGEFTDENFHRIPMKITV